MNEEDGILKETIRNLIQDNQPSGRVSNRDLTHTKQKFWFIKSQDLCYR
jgi:hypothetical protein